MSDVKTKSVTEVFRDGKTIQAALTRAVQEAVLMHKRIGNPIATWRDGKVVWLQPDEIPEPPKRD